MNKFNHSVYLDEDLCRGCINCLKRCPTQAIRVRDQKAKINPKFCIDCGECIRLCPHHAKKASYDSLNEMNKYKYKVALPAPALYSQFNHLYDVNIVLNGLLNMGFDDVYEVSAAAEIVSEATRTFLEEHDEISPWISTACPTIVRLIRVKFPNLIPHLLPLNPPIEVAAQIAAQNAIKKTSLPREDIAICFISPCPSKVTYAKSPLGTEKSEVDHVFAIKKVYPELLSSMHSLEENIPHIASSGSLGINWGRSGGEAGGLFTDQYLAADGIENVIRVLEDLEDEKFTKLRFVELNSCNSGCIGGVLTVENPYLAKVKLKHIRKNLPLSLSCIDSTENANQYTDWSKKVEYEPVFRLGKTIIDSFAMMNQVERVYKKLPGLDCGSCGAPDCRAMAEDIIKGEATEQDCIHLLKETLLNERSEK